MPQALRCQQRACTRAHTPSVCNQGHHAAHSTPAYQPSQQAPWQAGTTATALRHGGTALALPARAKAGTAQANTHLMHRQWRAGSTRLPKTAQKKCHACNQRPAYQPPQPAPQEGAAAAALRHGAWRKTSRLWHRPNFTIFISPPARPSARKTHEGPARLQTWLLALPGRAALSSHRPAGKAAHALTRQTASAAACAAAGAARPAVPRA